jgi:hypothetical protein
MAYLVINIHETEKGIYSRRNVATSLKRLCIALKSSSHYFKDIGQLHQKLLRLKTSRSDIYTAWCTGCLRMKISLTF